MANSILKLKVETSEYDQKLANAAKGIRHLADVAHKGAGELTGLEKSELDYIRSLGEMETKSRTASGQVRELSSTYKELKVVYDQLNEVEKADEGGKALAASLEKLKQRAQEAKAQLDSASQSLQSNGEAGKDTSSVMDMLKEKFTVNIDAIKLFNIGLQTAEGALNVAKDAFFASEATVDEWGRVVDSSKSLYEGFLTALNTGDISGYLGRIDEIVNAARKAYDELDRLGTMKTIQAPKMSAQQTENERMRMMIQTGRYIAPVDGRRASMKDGQLLTPDQIRRLETQLQNGMKSVVSLVGNEVKQTGKAIDAVYNRQAQELGMSLKEFRKGTSSMAEFDKRMAGYDKYQKWREQHTTIDMQSGREIVARGNPFEQFAKWGTFRVDGQRYNDLVRLIQQRDQQAAQAYGMQSQAYRTMNRAEGITVSKLMKGETAGGTTTTHKVTPQEQSTAKYEQAEKDYQQAVEQAALEMRAGTITQEGQRRKELQAKEALWKAIGDAREIYDTPELKAAQKKAADEIVRLGGEVKSLSEAEQRAKDAARQLESAQAKLAEAQKELSKAQASGDLKQIYAAEKKVETAQQAVTQSSTITVKVEDKEVLEQLQKLEGIQTIKVNVEEGEVNLPQVPTDDQTIKVNVEEGEVNLPQVPTDDQTIKVNVEEGEVNLPQVPTDDQTIKVNVVVDDVEAIESIQQLEGVTIDVPVNYKPQDGNLKPVEIPLATANLDAFTSRIKEELANADLGSSAALSLQEGLSDATAIGTILQTAIQNGIDTAQFDTSGLMEKLINHKDISDEQIQAYVDQLNEKLKEKFDETEWPKVLIKFNADTKSIEKMSKEQQKDAHGMSKEWQAVSSSISAVGAAMNSIKDPTAKIVGIVMSGIASVSQGAGQAISKAGSTTTSWYEYLAAAAAITAQMVTTIAQIHDVTGYANGGIVDGRGGGFVGGTAYSGDNIGNVRLDAGELVLNRSQQGNLATALEGNAFGNMELSTRLAGEDIIITINNVGERNGHGEYIEM